jgi:hypothetical protein
MPCLPRIEHRRRRLGAFLRAQRERVVPEAAGLPATRRRRTPGLRREELASLAGMSATWYTRIEQGVEGGERAFHRPDGTVLRLHQVTLTWASDPDCKLVVRLDATVLPASPADKKDSTGI